MIWGGVTPVLDFCFHPAWPFRKGLRQVVIWGKLRLGIEGSNLTLPCLGSQQLIGLSISNPCLLAHRTISAFHPILALITPKFSVLVIVCTTQTLYSGPKDLFLWLLESLSADSSPLAVSPLQECCLIQGHAPSLGQPAASDWSVPGMKAWSLCPNSK